MTARLDTPRPDLNLLHDARRTKGTAFTEAERAAHGLTGLLPPAVETLELQVQRVRQHLAVKPSDLERYIYLQGLRDLNETLFFKVMMADPAGLVPIVYAPTVGEACLKFSHIYRRSDGLYVSIKDRGHVREVLRHWPVKDVRFICVSTGGRILGLGDLGANGMGIPIGKLQLYTACAAVPPQGLLPLLLDCGTDNEELLKDPLYLGLRQPRPSTDELDVFVEEFVEAVQDVFPGGCIHFEDWKGTDAIRLLARYRDQVLCYNDDIQGTGAVALAGLMGALRITGQPLKELKVLFFGAGSASIGMANLLVSALVQEGLSEEQARSQIAMFNSSGLLEASRQDLSPEQAVFAHAHAPVKNLIDAINSLKPTALVGVSTVGGAFTQAVVKAMSKVNERPIIFALSNPTEKAECTAQQAYAWSGGQAVYAAGVPFPPVTIGKQTFVPGQANNFYVFPGLSLGVFAARPRRITDELWIEAARALAEQVTDEQRTKGMVFPPQSDILTIATRVGIAVAQAIFDQNLTQVPRPQDMELFVRGLQYQPDYHSE